MSKPVMFILVVLLYGFSWTVEASVCQPLVIGFHGATEAKSKTKIVRVIRSIDVKYKTYVVGNDSAAVQSARRYTADFRKRCPRARIAFIGHSWGGDGAFTAALLLQEAKKSVDVLVTIDPVSHSAIRPRGFHTTKWFNVYPARVPQFSRAVGAGKGGAIGCALGTLAEAIATAACGGIPCAGGSLIASGCTLGGGIGYMTGRGESGCEIAAHAGGFWGHEDKAINKRVSGVDHCDTMELYNAVRKQVYAILRR